MNQTQLLQDFESLPQNAQQEIIDFVEFIKLRYGKSTSKISLSVKVLHDWDNEAFVGMWKDRTDMLDSSVWVKNLRDEWSSS